MSNYPEPTDSGTIPFTVEGETFHTFYKTFGDLANRAEGATPLIILHGGPGLIHDYCLPMSDIATLRSVPVIFYDQIGNGKSTHVGQRDRSFWTIDLFIAELENLLSHFGIQDNFDIFGHSWGGILGVEFAIRRQPRGLRHLILADSLAAMELWDRSNRMLLDKFPQEVKEALAAGFEADKQKYRWAVDQFNAVHVCTTQPFPPEITASFDAVYGPNGDRSVSTGMGPELSKWTVEDSLHKVLPMTFVINGRDDIAQDFVVAPFFQRIGKVKWMTFEKSSHMPMFEERERHMKVVSDFLLLL